MLSFILKHHKMQFCPSKLFQIDLSNGADWKDIAHNNIYCTALFSLRYKISTNKMLNIYVLLQHSIGLSFCKSRAKSILDSSAEKISMTVSGVFVRLRFISNTKEYYIKS